MKKREPISAIMTTNVITLNYNDSLETAERLFKKHKIRHIPVINGGTIKGMLSYTDLLRISFADSVEDEGDNVDTVIYDMFTIYQVMTKNLTTVSTDATIKDVAEILASHEFHALPVVNEGKLMGIVTTTDLIRYLLAQY